VTKLKTGVSMAKNKKNSAYVVLGSIAFILTAAYLRNLTEPKKI
jgi:hypothetical protein